eukprot:1009808-Amorphochlora_amoeboformis.AAC.1
MTAPGRPRRLGRNEAWSRDGEREMAGRIDGRKETVVRKRMPARAREAGEDRKVMAELRPDECHTV